MELEGKVSIVTGGGQGIGKAIALRLAREGADVAVFDLNEETAKEVVQEIEKLGRKGIAIKGDVSARSDVERMVRETIEKLGGVDILVNNAAYVAPLPQNFVDETEDYWDRVLAVSLKGYILCSRAVLDHFMSKKSGKIVNIASDAGRVGQQGQTVYSAAKGGVIAFTKALAKEMARFGITINCVAPGATDTPAFRQMPEKMREAVPKFIPLGRIGRPEDVAGVVFFLCSRDGDYLTGQVISVSGGYTMI